MGAWLSCDDASWLAYAANVACNWDGELHSFAPQRAVFNLLRLLAVDRTILHLEAELLAMIEARAERFDDLMLRASNCSLSSDASHRSRALSTLICACEALISGGRQYRSSTRLAQSVRIIEQALCRSIADEMRRELDALDVPGRLLRQARTLP